MLSLVSVVEARNLGCFWGGLKVYKFQATGSMARARARAVQPCSGRLGEEPVTKGSTLPVAGDGPSSGRPVAAVAGAAPAGVLALVPSAGRVALSRWRPARGWKILGALPEPRCRRPEAQAQSRLRQVAA